MALNIPDPEGIYDIEWSKVRIVSPVEFVDRRDKLPLDLQAFLTPLKEWDYEAIGTVLYLSNDDHCGFGINPDGQLISVFSLEKERGPMLVRVALEKGGKFLNCLGDKLKVLYEDAGFKVAHCSPWNEECAPKNWNKEKFGTPNYYEMSLV